MSQFDSFKLRLKEFREKAEAYEDKDELNKSLDTVEKAWESAAKAAKLAECEQVSAAIGATQRSADILAFNILFCDTSKVTPEQLLFSIVKFQALEQVRGAFSPVAAQSLEESVAAAFVAKEIEE